MQGTRRTPCRSYGTPAAGIYRSHTRHRPATIDSMAAQPEPRRGRRALAGQRPDVLPDQLRGLPRPGGKRRRCSRSIPCDFPAEPAHRDPPRRGATATSGAMIRNGRGLMPPYNRIEEMDRWDVVNYVRGLQGRYPVAVAQSAARRDRRQVPGDTRWARRVRRPITSMPVP